MGSSRIGVFCDVDEVLTEVPVNMQLARLLEVSKQLKLIEDQFRRDGSTIAFNEKFIPLFRGAQFNRIKAAECYGSVQLRNRASELLKLRGVDMYLVSSGPSYYLDILANKHTIDIDSRCIYSRYNFDDDGALSSKNHLAVGEASKKAYVKDRAKDYDLTIGIGNSILLDGAFLAQCTVALLVGSLEPGYLCVNQLDPIIDLIDGLRDSISGR